jgi:hypothetical protein
MELWYLTINMFYFDLLSSSQVSEDTTNNSQLFITTIVFGTMSQTDYMLIVYCFNRHIERVLRWNTSLKFIKRSL